MPEIRINSRPCPNCGHRNVTAEFRVCERCGTSLNKARNRRFMLGSALGVAAVALCILIIWQPWADSNRDWVRETSNRPERVQDPVPTQPKLQERKIEQPQQQTPSQEEAPVQYADEKPAPIQEELNDVVENETVPAEAERFSSLTVEKKVVGTAYDQLTSQARMLASDLDVRVESTGSSRYDNKHFDRLVDMLNEPDFQGKELFLVGIAGSVGNDFIAKNRADFAKKILKEKYNISIAISTFGYSSETDEPAYGQRLEAWVK